MLPHERLKRRGGKNNQVVLVASLIGGAAFLIIGGVVVVAAVAMNQPGSTSARKGGSSVSLPIPSPKDVMSGRRVVKTFSGYGDEKTPHFNVRDDWEFTYENRDGFRQVILWNENDEMEKRIIDLSDLKTEPEGSCYVGDGGRFQLEVICEGPWELKVVELGGKL